MAGRSECKDLWVIVADMCEQYAVANIHGRPQDTKVNEKYLEQVMKNEYGTPSPQVFHALLDTFFLTKQTYPSNMKILYPVRIALRNPACPPLLLAAAACNAPPSYKVPAMANPSCPEEYEVYFALWKRGETS